MADMLSVLEDCRISPPPNTVGDKSLPLTFFDMIWLQVFPVNQLFLYEYPHSNTHFVEKIIPNLKQSLSITLQHFFPFSSNLILFPNPNHSGFARKPEIRHVEGDFVTVLFAESSLDFKDLIGNHPRACHKFHPLVPRLGCAKNISDHVSIPLFAVQVTLFPNSGISIGFTNHHTLCDASSKYDFLKAWTSIATTGTDDLFLASGFLPFYDRAIKYPEFLDEIFMNQSGIETLLAGGYQPPHPSSDINKVRATIILTKTNINRLKKWLSIQMPASCVYASSFSVACAYVWSCIAKSGAQTGEMKGDDDLERFICAVDWRGRINPPVPQTYFGNFVGLCETTKTKSTSLSGEHGFLTAVELLGKAISETIENKDGLLKDADTWIERAYDPVPTIGVAGTPKIKIYETDFGWGKPKKYETISIDHNGSLSINASKESPEDIEIGLSLPAKQMDAFLTISSTELESMIHDQE